MNSNTITHGDIIEQLPTDSSVPSHNEIRVVDQLFKENQGVIGNILTHSKDLMLLAVLYVLFSLPYTDELIKNFIPSASKSSFILIGVKTALFILLFFVVNNMYLMKK